MKVVKYRKTINIMRVKNQNSSGTEKFVFQHPCNAPVLNALQPLSLLSIEIFVDIIKYHQWKLNNILKM